MCNLCGEDCESVGHFWVSWEGRSHAVLFMVLLGPPGARHMAQALRLPFEYYIIKYCYIV